MIYYDMLRSRGANILVRWFICTILVDCDLFCHSYFSSHKILGFSWQSLLPLLISKAAELMQIPASAGVEGVSVVQTNEFPHAFPAQYARILLVQSTQQNGADARTMALKKLAKLLHFVTSAYVKDDAGLVLFFDCSELFFSTSTDRKTRERVFNHSFITR